MTSTGVRRVLQKELWEKGSEKNGKAIFHDPFKKQQRKEKQ